MISTFAALALSPHCVHTRLTQTGRSSPQRPGHHENQGSDIQPGSEGSLMRMTKVMTFSYCSSIKKQTTDKSGRDERFYLSFRVETVLAMCSAPPSAMSVK